MKITYREYTLTPSVNAVERFDLSRAIRVTATKDIKSGIKKGQKYNKDEELGYGYNLDSAIQKIIAFELIKKDDVADLKAYLEAYKGIKEDIVSLLSV